MVKQSIAATRRDVWNFALEHYIGEKKKVPVDILRLGLLSIGKARITKKGIVFQGVIYTSLDCLDSFSLARSKKTQVVDIRYVPMNANFIFWKDFTGITHQLYLHEDCRRFKDSCYHDVLIQKNIESTKAKYLNLNKLAADIDRLKKKALTRPRSLKGNRRNTGEIQKVTPTRHTES